MTSPEPGSLAYLAAEDAKRRHVPDHLLLATRLLGKPVHPVDDSAHRVDNPSQEDDRLVLPVAQMHEAGDQFLVRAFGSGHCYSDRCRRVVKRAQHQFADVVLALVHRLAPSRDGEDRVGRSSVSFPLSGAGDDADGAL